MEKEYISLWKYIDADLGRAMFILIYKFKGYYVNEIKLINFVQKFYDIFLAEIFRLGLALTGEPPLSSTVNSGT